MPTFFVRIFKDFFKQKPKGIGLGVVFSFNIDTFISSKPK